MIARFASRTRSERGTSSTGSPPKNTIKPGRLESMARTIAHQQSAGDLDDLADQVVWRGRGQKQDLPYRLLRRPLSAHGMDCTCFSLSTTGSGTCSPAISSGPFHKIAFMARASFAKYSG